MATGTRATSALVIGMGWEVGRSTAGDGRRRAFAASESGSQMLGLAHVRLLEKWLGEGPLQFRRIYAKQPEHTSADFHAAVDGRGRTFTVIELPAGSLTSSTGHYQNPTRELIGGYNPQSWHSGGWYNVTESDKERTAFLFNLTTQEVERQNLSNGHGIGQYQTFNHAACGPAFGGGHDLLIGTSLTAGFRYKQSYGGQKRGQLLAGPLFYCSLRQIGAIEVFTFESRTERRRGKNRSN